MVWSKGKVITCELFLAGNYTWCLHLKLMESVWEIPVGGSSLSPPESVRQIVEKGWISFMLDFDFASFTPVDTRKHISLKW